MPFEVRPIVMIALGGNAISPSNELGTITEQFDHTRVALRSILPLIRKGLNVAIAHGNGPQVGAAMRRVELSEHEIPPLPLGVCVAATQGTIGYMIEQSMHNILMDEEIHRDVVSFITQVIVDENDPAIADPTKYVGHTYDKAEAERLARENGWIVKEQSAGEWRRVVPSPKPLKVNNSRSVKHLVESGAIVIVSGGGGIPAYRGADGHFEGVDAVIDKDLAAAVLGTEIDARDLYILTDVPEVYINFGTDKQEAIREMTASEAKAYLQEGQFPPGSMGPKVEAAINFIKGGGEKVIITGIDSLATALEHKSGTVITA